jgi:hypothetical protein
MLFRSIISVGFLVGMLFMGRFAIAPLAGQTPGTAGKASNAWKLPRTSEGKPDLQGMWVNFDRTPFERPLQNTGPAQAPAPTTGAAQVAGFSESPAIVAARRPALVVEPPNGRVPVLEWAEKLKDFKVEHIGDTWENGTTWDRCLTRGIPGAIFPAGYNNAYRIVQSAGNVTIVYEMIHLARVIPTDGSPHLPDNVRLWDGDSRGRWEGDTLVVDITNYNGKGDIATNMASGRIRGIPASDQLRVVERFTRVSADVINYEATITDPKVYSAPWKVAMPLTRDDTYEMYEYACHEGNVYFMNTTLGGGRAQEQVGSGQRPR